METCSHSLQLSAYHDGELSPPQREQFERHLAGCPACADELEQFRRLSALLDAAPRPRLGDDSRRELYALAPQVEEAGFLRIAKWTTALAASVMLAASVWVMSHQPGAQAFTDVPRAWEQDAINPPSDASAEPRFAEFVVNGLSSDNGS
jgi:anti-sigma factor RsiW